MQLNKILLMLFTVWLVAATFISARAKLPNKTDWPSNTPYGQQNLVGYVSNQTKLDSNQRREERIAKIIESQKKRLEHLPPRLRDRLEKKLTAFEQYISSNGGFSQQQGKQDDNTPIQKPSSNRNPRTTSSENVTQAWEAKFNGPSSADQANALAVDGHGNVYVTGYCDFLGGTGVTVKYNASGTEAWYRYFFGKPTSIAVDNTGNVYITGDSTIEYNSLGNVIWQRKDLSGSAIKVDNAGNVYVTGLIYDTTRHNNDYMTVKYNAFGFAQWAARYNGPGNGSDGATAIAVDSIGNVYVTGQSVGDTSGNDYATIKYNAFGFAQWAARYNGPGNGSDGATAIAVDGVGNVYATGYSFSDTGGFDYATIKYDSAGVQQWVARYNGGSDDYATAIAIDGQGNVYVTGDNRVAGYAAIKYDSAGVQQWVSLYPGQDWLNNTATIASPAIAIDSSGNVVVSGISKIVKYNSTGLEQWVLPSPSSSTYLNAYLNLDGSGNVYVTGTGIGSYGGDYETMKYDPSGTQQWGAQFFLPVTGLSSNEVFAMTTDSVGNIYVTGATWGGNISGPSYYGSYSDNTVKYNSTGDTVWVGHFWNPTTNSGIVPSAIVTDNLGNVYLTGYPGPGYGGTMKYKPNGDTAWVRLDIQGLCLAIDNLGNVYVTGGDSTAKLNTNGKTVWTRGDIVGRAIAVDSTGNVYLAGSANDAITGEDYLTAKLNTAGVVQWVASYTGPGNKTDYANAIALDGIGNVYVTGGSQGDTNEYDYATIKYNSIGVQQWVARYNNPGDWIGASAIAVDKSGNVFVSGEYGTIKYSSTGDSLWFNGFGAGIGDGTFYPNGQHGLILDVTGNAYVRGDGAIGKFSPAGLQQWNVDVTNKAVTADFALDNSGNVFVTFDGVETTGWGWGLLNSEICAGKFIGYKCQ